MEVGGETVSSRFAGQSRGKWGWLWFAAHLSLVPCVLAADPPAAVPQITVNLLELPSSRQAQSALQTQARFFWEQTPLRLGLQELNRTYGISIWLDRELDPTQLVTVEAPASEASRLWDRFRQIAGKVDAEVGLVENVVYIGPRQRVPAVQRAAVELHDQLSRGDARTAQMRGWSWSELSSSSELLQQLEQQWQCEISGSLPHDLYHAGALMQPCTLATQLSILAGSFGLQARWHGAGQLRLEPLVMQSQWQANYRKEDLELRGLSPLQALYPGAECQTRGSLSLVRGVTNFHVALLSFRDPPAGKRGSATLDQARWGFEVRNTAVEAVLNKLAGSLNLTFEWDAACTADMRRQLVSFKVDQATTDQLLAEISRVSGLKFSRRDSRVLVQP